MSARIAFLVLAVIATSASARAADVDAGRRKSEGCAACHGRDGNATIPGTPSLAGQPAYYTHWQLVMFRNERRRDPQMAPLAARLSDEDMADLAAYYAAQISRPRPQPMTVDLATRNAGRRLTDVHHCTACHGPGLMGQEAVPRLAGQDHQYLLKRLRGYKAQTTSDLEGFMTSAAQPLTNGEIEILARYIASLKTGRDDGARPRDHVEASHAASVVAGETTEVVRLPLEIRAARPRQALDLHPRATGRAPWIVRWK